VTPKNVRNWLRGSLIAFNIATSVVRFRTRFDNATDQRNSLFADDLVRREGTFKLAARLFSFVEIAAIDWLVNRTAWRHKRSGCYCCDCGTDPGRASRLARSSCRSHWKQTIFDGNDVKHLLCEQSHYAVRCFSSHALLPSTVNRKKLRRFRGAGKNCILKTHRWKTSLNFRRMCCARITPPQFTA